MAAIAMVGTFCSDRVERLQRVGAHEEVELADRQQDAVVDLRAARHDGHVEPVLAVSAVGERLVEPAVLGLGHPVGAERDLVERLRGGRAAPQGCHGSHEGRQDACEDACGRHGNSPDIGPKIGR